MAVSFPHFLKFKIMHTSHQILNRSSSTDNLSAHAVRRGCGRPSDIEAPPPIPLRSLSENDIGLRPTSLIHSNATSSSWSTRLRNLLQTRRTTNSIPPFVRRPLPSAVVTEAPARARAVVPRPAGVPGPTLSARLGGAWSALHFPTLTPPWRRNIHNARGDIHPTFCTLLRWKIEAAIITVVGVGSLGFWFVKLINDASKGHVDEAHGWHSSGVP